MDKQPKKNSKEMEEFDRVIGSKVDLHAENCRGHLHSPRCLIINIKQFITDNFTPNSEIETLRSRIFNEWLEENESEDDSKVTLEEMFLAHFTANSQLKHIRLVISEEDGKETECQLEIGKHCYDLPIGLIPNSQCISKGEVERFGEALAKLETSLGDTDPVLCDDETMYEDYPAHWAYSKIEDIYLKLSKLLSKPTKEE